MKPLHRLAALTSLALLPAIPTPAYAQQGICITTLGDTTSPRLATLKTRLALRVRNLNLECPAYTSTVSARGDHLLTPHSDLMTLLETSPYSSIEHFQVLLLNVKLWEYEPGQFDVVVLRTSELYDRIRPARWKLLDGTVIPETAFWGRDFTEATLPGAADQIIDALLTTYRGLVPIN